MNKYAYSIVIKDNKTMEIYFQDYLDVIPPIYRCGDFVHLNNELYLVNDFSANFTRDFDGKIFLTHKIFVTKEEV